jgi:serine/threonine protein phosphatase PrpC
MEDAICANPELNVPLKSYAMFGIFDGHGGGEVSRFIAAELPNCISACGQQALQEGCHAADVAQQALERALPVLDQTLREVGDGIVAVSSGKQINVHNAFARMGSTAVVALLEFDDSRHEGLPARVIVANCGDSRAVLSRAGNALALTEDHKPEDPVEKARIENAGGFVGVAGPCQRIDGCGLNLSRALGDFDYKARCDLAPGQQKVSCVPDVRCVDITPEDEFLLLGCDGVFELHSNQSVVDLVRAGIAAGQPLQEVVETLVDACCASDLQMTRFRGGDNVSAIVIVLQPELAQIRSR